MQERKVAGVTYTEMDMLDLKFDKGYFQSIIDKGSFDALCSDKTPETLAKVNVYLKGLMNVLGSGESSYLCVSLLQDFVLEALLDFFTEKNGDETYDVHIFAIKTDKAFQTHGQAKYLPFMLKVTKTTGAGKLYLKNSIDQAEWTEYSREELTTRICLMQKETMFMEARRGFW
jgi:hypothetical protein